MEPFLLIKTLLILFAVIFFLYGCLLLYRRRLNTQKKSSLIKIIEHREIHQKLSVTIIEAEKQRFMLATSTHGIAMTALENNGHNPLEKASFINALAS